ncbi:hypothetical protein Agabi119p4_1907 [Agaricus bisporus var. burnettii]|uniref:Uncharacterized protein n=1 Tax=Agaricus bisporus var. burnettii TaxID=192524 RepID=A0A8H7F826_AGABI|nr:hypothetical protein Agabi119p4_1907 [Agaricus bisporus var. burnettii]
MDRQPTDYKGHSDISARWNRSRHDQSPPPWSQPNAPSRPQSMSADWASLFSAPLNPSVFAALAASGVFGHLPQGGPFNVPAFPADFHPSTSSSPAPSLSSTPGSWSQPSSSYGTSNPSHFPYKTPHPRQSPQLHKDRPSSFHGKRPTLRSFPDDTAHPLDPTSIPHGNPRYNQSKPSSSNLRHPSVQPVPYTPDLSYPAADTPRTLRSPVSAASTATESKSNMFSDLFTDDLFNPKASKLIF